MPNTVVERLEVEAASMVGDPGTTDEVVALASIAISLKRLADTAEMIREDTHNLGSLSDIELHMRKRS